MHARQNRPAFLLMAPAMLGITLLGFVVFVGVLTAFTGVIQGGMIEALTDIPTMHAYAPDGSRITEVSPDVEVRAQAYLDERDNLRDQITTHVTHSDYDAITRAEERIDEINRTLLDMGYVDDASMIITMYQWFAVPSITILLLIIIFSAAAHFWERGFGWWRKGAAYDMFRASIMGIIAIIILPEAWDVYAIYMESLAIHMIHPHGADPQMVIDRLWCKMGASAGCMLDFAGLLDPVSWSTALASPNDFGQSLLGEILMPFFKLMPAFALMLSAFIIGEIRVLLMTIVLITFPMWMVLRNVSFLRQHSGSMTMALVGGSFAPFLSGVTLYVGWTYVSNYPLPSIEEWIAVFGILVLAGAWPALLVPFLRTVSGQVDKAVSTAVTSTSMMAMQMGMGAAGGAIAGAQATKAGLKTMVGGALLGGGKSMIAAMPAESQMADSAISAGKTVADTRFGRTDAPDQPHDRRAPLGGWLSGAPAGTD